MDRGSPLGSSHLRMRANDWDPICEKHYGQRPCTPHKQARHMTAPTNAAATSKKFLPIRRRPHMTQSGLRGAARWMVYGCPIQISRAFGRHAIISTRPFFSSCVLNSQSRVGNTADRNPAGHLEAAHLGNLDSHIATVRSPAARNSVADSPAANLGAGGSPHSD